MANPEHLEILKQGVEVWNEYTLKYRKQMPDFSDANLRGAKLSRVNFNITNLSGADLTGANLIDADLSNAMLINANCTDADLGGVNLSYANLEAANFTRADLMFAYLIDTELTSACFNEAKFYETRLINVDLSDVIGLETAKHEFRSNIDIATIYRSQGQIPEIFLRGCGIPDNFIAYVQSLTDQTIQFYSCFISYSSKDQDFAERVYTDLQNKGVRCWFAPEDLKIGDKIRDRIDESIRLRDKLLLILSESSVASEWVEHEVESALEEERRSGRTILFPIRIDDAVFDCSKAWASLIRRTRHVGDFTRWKDQDLYHKAFDRLLRDLKAEEKKF